MWYWTCPRSPGLLTEHHSFEQLDEMLTGHENGLKVEGFREIPPCPEEHEYWDDGVPCRYDRCRIPYVRDDEYDV